MKQEEQNEEDYCTNKDGVVVGERERRYEGKAGDRERERETEGVEDMKTRQEGGREGGREGERERERERDRQREEDMKARKKVHGGGM